MSQPTPEPPARPGQSAVPARSWLPLWCLLAVIWGSSFLLIKGGADRVRSVAARDAAECQRGRDRLADPARVAAAAAVRTDRVVCAAITGLLLAGLPAVLFAWAETRITSVLAGLFNAATPLFTALAGLSSPADSGSDPTARSGSSSASPAWPSCSAQHTPAGGLAGSAAAIGATVCYDPASSGSSASSRHGAGRPGDGRGAADLRRRAAGRRRRRQRIAAVDVAGKLGPTLAVVALGAIGTGTAYVIFYRVLRLAGPLTSSTITYASPLVSILLGVTLLGETLRWNQPVGAAIVLTGVALVQGFLRPLPERR